MPELARDVWRLGLVLVVLGGLGGLAWKFGGPAWRDWKRRQALVQAEEFASRNDYRNAVLALRRATEATPGDAQVWTEAAAFLSRIGSPEAVVARQNLTRIAPTDMNLRVALVTEALRFRDVETAREGLQALERAGQDDVGFHRLAAAVALALGETAELEARLERLVALDAGDAAARFNLAALRAWSDDEARARAAAAELEALGAEPSLRLRVALERLKLVAATRDPAQVDAAVVALLGELEPATLTRRPERSTPGEPPGWDALLAALKRVAAEGGANDAALLARWLGEMGPGGRALAWIDSLPEGLRGAPELASAAADLAARVNDLPRLRSRLEQGAWGAMPRETIDLALAARTQALRFGVPRSRTTWDDAVVTAKESLSALRALARLAGAWRDAEGADAALQAIVDRFPREFWACEALRASYAARRETEKLWRLYQTWAPRVPEHTAVQQTWVMLGALLNRSDAAQLRRIVDGLAREGADPAPATLLAATAARWRAGLHAEAAAALARLTGEGAEEPRAWLWRAVLAAQADETDALAATLARVPRERLTREEQQVLGAALTEHERRRRAAERSATAPPLAPEAP